MKLEALGASREVGRSAFVLETDSRILLDYGVKLFSPPHNEPAFPPLPRQINHVIISHAHLDHSGYIPNLYTFYDRLRWYSTPPTFDIYKVLEKDSMKLMGKKLPYSALHFKKSLKNFSPVEYNEGFDLGKTHVEFYDAGHILGSAMVLIEYQNKRICYTGDFKLESTRMHKGAEPIKDVDYLIIESTYAFREHPDRRALEKELLDKTKDTIYSGGTVLFPAFAVGRSQEIGSILTDVSDFEVYLDGMSREISTIYTRYGEYLRHPEVFREKLKRITFVHRQSKREKIVKDPVAIISTAGMLQGGPALFYLTNLKTGSRIIFTGYNVEGTNGWRLLNESKVEINGELLNVDLPVEYLDFSAHAGRTDLLTFIKTANPQKIVVVHGDETERFAQELREMGFDAVAPQMGDVVQFD